MQHGREKRQGEMLRPEDSDQPINPQSPGSPTSQTWAPRKEESVAPHCFDSLPSPCCGTGTNELTPFHTASSERRHTLRPCEGKVTPCKERLGCAVWGSNLWFTRFAAHIQEYAGFVVSYYTRCTGSPLAGLQNSWAETGEHSLYTHPSGEWQMWALKDPESSS